MWPISTPTESRSTPTRRSHMTSSWNRTLDRLALSSRAARIAAAASAGVVRLMWQYQAKGRATWPLASALPMCFTRWQSGHRATSPSSRCSLRRSSNVQTSWHSTGCLGPTPPQTEQRCPEAAAVEVCRRSQVKAETLLRTFLYQQEEGTSSIVRGRGRVTVIDLLRRSLTCTIIVR